MQNKMKNVHKESNFLSNARDKVFVFFFVKNRLSFPFLSFLFYKTYIDDFSPFFLECR